MQRGWRWFNRQQNRAQEGPIISFKTLCGYYFKRQSNVMAILNKINFIVTLKKIKTCEWPMHAAVKPRADVGIHKQDWQAIEELLMSHN